MDRLEVGIRVATQYKGIANREGILKEFITDRFATIEGDDGEITHHKTRLLKPAGGTTNV